MISNIGWGNIGPRPGRDRVYRGRCARACGSGLQGTAILLPMVIALVVPRAASKIGALPRWLMVPNRLRTKNGGYGATLPKFLAGRTTRGIRTAVVNTMTNNIDPPELSLLRARLELLESSLTEETSAHARTKELLQDHVEL